MNAVIAAIDENIRNVVTPPNNLYNIPPIRLPIAKPKIILIFLLSIISKKVLIKKYLLKNQLIINFSYQNHHPYQLQFLEL